MQNIEALLNSGENRREDKGRRILELALQFGALAAAHLLAAVWIGAGWKAYLLFPVGVVSWSVAEYFLHRFPLHAKPHGKSFWNRMTAGTHWDHHRHPMDNEKLTAYTLFTMVLYVPFFLLFLLITLSVEYALVLGSGFIVGYVIYEYIHWACHHRPMQGIIGKKLKRHHMIHHHKNPYSCYGVTHPLFDWVFGTWQR